MRKALRLIGLRLARLWWVMILISAFGTALGYAWWHFDFLEMSDDERNAYDDGLKRFNNKKWFPWGHTQQSEDITLLAIDEATFNDVASFPPWKDRYGSWPYDRIIWADVLRYLDTVGVKLVVMDWTLAENKADVTGDVKLGEAIAEVKFPVVMGFNAVENVPPLPKVDSPQNRLHQPKPPPAAQPKTEAGGSEDPGEFPEEPSPEEQRKAREAAAEQLRKQAAPAFAFPVTYEGGLTANDFEPTRALGFADGGLASVSDLKRDAGVTTIELPRFPVPAISQVIDVTSGFGAVETEADEDGKMRETRFVYSDGVNDYVTLPLAAVADLWSAEKVTFAPNKLQIGTHGVRINRDGSARINYGGTLEKRFHSVPLVGALRAALPNATAEDKAIESYLKGRIVFIGAIAQGAGDQKPTPFGAQEAGVVKQMAVVDNLLHDRFILEAPEWGSVLLAFMVALFSVALVMVAQSFITDVGAPVFLTFAFFLITGGFITFTNIHVLSAMPGMAGTLAALFATTYNRFLASKDREHFRDAVGAYLHPDLVEELAEQATPPSLKGTAKEVTAFFSDIKGYTAITEALKDKPGALMDLLREYFDVVVPLLKDEGGIIDKYIGDAVVAVFGAPKEHGDHALRACQAALNVQRGLSELNATLKERGLPTLTTRVGINTDVMWVGNVGSQHRPFNYTAMGDGMNLASRLEATNKAYDTLILIGPNTHAVVKSHFVTRELDSIRVQGKNEVITLHELLGEQVSPQKRQVLELYASALELYRAKRFSESLKTLKDAYDIDATDGPVKVLAGKCNQFMQHPPPADWDGVTQVEK